MKTKTTISRIAKKDLISLAVIFAAALTPALAGGESASERIGESKTRLEVEAAHDRLEVFANAIEKSVKFQASRVNEDIVAYEVLAAEERLENMNLLIANAARYEASMVNEEAEAFELAVAEERLEKMNIAAEESIKFNPEDDKIEYADSIEYPIPSEEIGLSLVSAR